LGQWGVLISIIGGAVLSAYDRYKSKKEQQIVDSQLILRDLLDVPNYSKKLTTEQQVEQDLTTLFRIIKKNSVKKESRLVIFIDDLDRCSPNHITEVLEALNLFISSEFQNSYFVIGMDPEFVSAAIEESYINVIRRLSPISQKIGMGWNFMNKFIQLPVILPRPEKKNIETYIASLLIEKKAERLNLFPIRMADAELLGSADKEKFLKGQKAAIEKIDKTKETYSDQDPIVRNIILDASKEFPNNPREMKRFLNILRFYYFIREGRKAAELPYPSLDQIKRWIILVMKWPQVAVWLQKGVMERVKDNPVGEKLQGLENNLVIDESKQVTAHSSNNEVQTTPQESNKETEENDIVSWMNDKNLSLFFANEINIKNKKPEEALSAANEKGLY
jgi:KAP family P-loop domain